MDALEQAVNECIKNGILADFLMKNKAEVLRMSLFEYDQEKHLQQEREAAEASGRMEQARAMAEELFKSGVPMETIAQAARVNVEVVQCWLEGLEVHP